ncbi:MAG TPA: O-methyltransferase [Solirubrobacter sp.]|nr:O-methyltransferase [Solirubrobacter sp.]
MASAYDFPGLYDYLTRFSGQDDVLAQVSRETSELPHAAMQSRADQGALLTLLGKLVGARVAIEVGTFTGYGAICIARGLQEGGHLTCFEVDAEYAEIARRNVALAKLDDRVTIEVGPAVDALAALPDTPHVDLAYVDADKPGYPAYYDALVPRMRPGGVLALDNMLLQGRVLDPQDDRSRTMAELNERIADDERVDSVLLGLSDGFTLVRRR